MLSNSLISIRNLEFLLWEWLDLDSLCQRPRFAAHTRADLSAMLELAHELSRRELAPYSRASDRHEPTVDEQGQVRVLPQSAHAVRSMADAGFFSTVFDESRGGLQLPNTFHMGAFALLMAGNMGTASYVLLTGGNARLISNFGNAAQIAAFAEPQISGQTMGTIWVRCVCLNRTQALLWRKFAHAHSPMETMSWVLVTA